MNGTKSFLTKCKFITEMTGRETEVDADPDLSRDTKLKQVFRNLTDFLYTQEKPENRLTKPLWHPKRWISTNFPDKDPHEDPRPPGRVSPLERSFNLL